MKIISAFFLILFSASTGAQNIPENWQLLDFQKDSVYGISMEKAYQALLKTKQPKPIIVAVIDNGTDTLHEDLKNVLWRNGLENGFDEDKNGYKGDIYGWNFLGGRDGQNFYKAPLEFERQYFLLKGKYTNMRPEDVKKKQQREYQLWLQVKEKFKSDSVKSVSGFWSSLHELTKADSLIRKALNKEEYVYGDLAGLDESKIGKNNFMMELLQFQPTTTNLQYLASRQSGMENVLMPFTHSTIAASTKQRQKIVGDRYHDFQDRFYGNNDIRGKSSTSMHGTHVAGIIGAERNNGKGMDGVANAVKIMSLRAVPTEGDEYDKDVALAIRYAVDNGAKVINMSFAKAYSPEQKWVEDAIRYAAKKDVLIVKGAGNESQNVDSIPAYPTAKYMRGNKRPPNMITVGASGPTKETLIAGFSNYGKIMVDVFAPGVDIYSSIPGNGENQYHRQSGTSMASPVVAGLASVLRSYYPMLSAKQIKHFIEASVTTIDGPITKPGQLNEKGLMRELCKTGGIVNAYRAIIMAEKFISKLTFNLFSWFTFFSSYIL